MNNSPVTLPVRLSSTPYEKVWGTPLTEPWYQNLERRDIGEIWFSASDQVPILVKFLFTSDRLSVQVHPEDEYARVHENSRGKTEMWHILRAEPDAQVALGLRETIPPERLRDASLSGEIENLLNWIPARPGDTFFVPAGTIHAIGGGLVLCEVQQKSDVTYRLYDYGRPRELHLDASMAVSSLTPYQSSQTPTALSDGHTLLAECQYFRTELLEVQGEVQCPAPLRNTLYIVLKGAGLIAGQIFEIGEAWEAAAGSAPFTLSSAAGATLLITSAP